MDLRHDVARTLRGRPGQGERSAELAGGEKAPGDLPAGQIDLDRVGQGDDLPRASSSAASVGRPAVASRAMAARQSRTVASSAGERSSEVR
jgi:hypothetical protein